MPYLTIRRSESRWSVKAFINWCIGCPKGQILHTWLQENCCKIPTKKCREELNLSTVLKHVKNAKIHFCKWWPITNRISPKLVTEKHGSSHFVKIQYNFQCNLHFAKKLTCAIIAITLNIETYLLFLYDFQYLLGNICKRIYLRLCWDETHFRRAVMLTFQWK